MTRLDLQRVAFNLLLLLAPLTLGMLLDLHGSSDSGWSRIEGRAEVIRVLPGPVLVVTSCCSSYTSPPNVSIAVLINHR
jgi:hypothetical protein